MTQDDADEQGRIAAAQDLIAKNLPLAHWYASKWAKRLPRHREAIDDAAVLGLVKAATSKRYDPSRGKLSTYVCASIRFEIMNSLRTEFRVREKKGGKIAYFSEIHEDFEKTMSFGQCDASAREDRDHAKSTIAAAISILDPRSKEVVSMAYGLDGKGERTLREMGGHFGVTKERIRQILLSSMRRMAAALEE